jgi:3-oxoacyl-[acyl-carrier protein] reductase
MTDGGGRLAGKTVVVTGAAHGIGRAYATRFAAEGANLVLCDLDGERLEEVAGELEATGAAILARRVDVRDYEALRGLAADAAARFGRIDGLVNNAGMLNVIPVSRVLFEDISEEEWDLVFDENIKSVWHCCRAFVPYMRDGRGGSIVNVASSTVFKPVTTRAHYVASKGAVVAFTRVLARELGADWIRVNVLAPGSTLSEEDPSPDVIRMREEAAAARALQRVQRPEDVVGAVLFLLSDDSAFMTGQSVIVEGGGIIR